MALDRVKLQDIVASQLPSYVVDDFPLLPEFLQQYYVSQEFQSGPVDILKNIDQYVKVDELFNLRNSTILGSDLSFVDTTISIASTTGTDGFCNRDGLIKIDDEIIYYEYKTDTTFENCSRGFSGITTYINSIVPDQLEFSQSQIDDHTKGTEVYNLNVLFLQQFFRRVKGQVTPGFENRTLYTGLNQRNFVYGADSFYTSKGTDESFKILFRALYGEEVEVIKPSEYLIRPSNADYKITQDYIVEAIQGDPLDLKNRTIFQDSTNARGSVSNVKQILYAGYEYYQISIDSGYSRDINVKGSIFGTFEPDPKTKILNNVSTGQTFIDVDSTIGFPEFGKLATVDIDGNNVSVAYSGKTDNQFFNVDGVLNQIDLTTDIRLDQFCYAYTDINQTNKIIVRMASSLKDFQLNEQANYYRPNDTILLKSLGLEATGKKSNNWRLNVKSKFFVEDIVETDPSNRIYTITSSYPHFFKVGYSISLINEDRTISINGEINSVANAQQFTIKLESSASLNQVYFVENNTLKGNSTRYPQLNNFIANVQNTYSKFNGDVLLSSNSIPNYNDIITNPYDRKVKFSQSVASGISTDVLTLPTNSTNLPDHGFYTGDSVIYTPGSSGFTGVTTGSYFIRRVDESNVKISRSKSDLFKNIFVSLEGTATDCSLEYLEFYNKDVYVQGIYREILPPNMESGTYETTSGYTGVFTNGVELLNYKSQNSVYYGDIQAINITKEGTDYDIINPPILNVVDETGFGVTGKTNTKGSLYKINITDPGFGYKEVPEVRIRGGNGYGAKAEAKLKKIDLELKFNAANPDEVSVSNNAIGFGTAHKLIDGDGLVYQPRNPNVVVGLNTNQRYFIHVVTAESLRFHNTEDDAKIGINTVEITGLGQGIQYFAGVKQFNVVSSIIVTDPGSGYENKERAIRVTDELGRVGVDTARNQFNIPNHGYKNGEIVRYVRGSNTVQGLRNKDEYYILHATNDSFKLAQIGSNIDDREFFYNNNVEVDLISTGDGTFNYQPISVEVKGLPNYFDKSFVSDFEILFVIESPIEENIETPDNVIAWTGPDGPEAEITNNGTVEGEFYVRVNGTSQWLISDEPFLGNQKNYDAEIEPLFRGAIKSIDITNGGVGYGASEIIDFNRQPDIKFETGGGARVTPIINDGAITSFIINERGTKYNTPPHLTIESETGNFAQLTPTIDSQGRLKDIIILDGGRGYVQGKTFITITPSGLGAIANADIHPWNVNLFERVYDNILSDDGIINENIGNTSLEYSHLYAARPLRESVFALNGYDEKESDNIKYGTYDLVKSGGVEVDSTNHSPIIGWAYDGNPIYGPYGYENNDGTGSIIKMTSGYVQDVSDSNRPSVNAFAAGFFVNDYTYIGQSTLDEHNGRFCVTPDFPNGVYAYFATIDDAVSGTGPFNNFFEPVFPYIIGNTYRCKPNPFNFKPSNNQNGYDITSDTWFRNSKFYFTSGQKNRYDYIFNSNEIIKQGYDVSASSSGTVDSLVVQSPGTNYKVNDQVVFAKEGTGGRGLDVKVSQIKGREVSRVSVSATSFEGVEFIPTLGRNSFVGIASYPHGFKNGDDINISGLSTTFDKFNSSYRVLVNTNTLNLTLGISSAQTTGIVTYFYVAGNLTPEFCRENDVFQINYSDTFEKVKVLNVDFDTKRIRVLRNYENTVGAAYTNNTLLVDLPRDFSITGTLSTTKTLVTNRQLYFDPIETVGLGTVGSGTTVRFSNPGIGVTQVFLQPTELYYKDHGLELNTPLKYQTGDGGTSMVVWNGTVNYPFRNLTDLGTLYAVPFSKNILGISSNRVGLNTISGNYVGVNSTAGLLSFTSVGAGDTHSFTTMLSDVVSADVTKNIVTVGLAETHSLRLNDEVTIDVKPTFTKDVEVIYNDFNRRVVFDPKNFAAVGVDTVRNLIQIDDHGFKLGDKVIHTAIAPAGGLVDNAMYFVVPLNDNTIQLTNEKYEAELQTPVVVGLSTQGPGTLSLINPEFTIQRNNNLRFVLDDSSLSFLNGTDSLSAFSFHIYNDPEFTDEFYSTKTTSTFEVSSTGKIGVDTGANVNILISDNLPQSLYYRLEPTNLNLIPPVKEEILIDSEVNKNSQINIVENNVDGIHKISGIGTTTFSYSIPEPPDTLEFNTSNSNTTYSTSSLTEKGPVHKVRIFGKGAGYKTLPGFVSIASSEGTGAIIEASSRTIGKILNVRANNIGFDYPTDTTMRGVANLPEILSVTPLLSFESIGISSGGVNYIFAPKLVVKDGFTNDLITDVELRYELGDTEVEIINNTNSLYNVTPNIYPIENSNGFSISSISYTNSTQIVRLTLEKQFSEGEDFPFKVGGNIMVENVSIGVGSTGKGYNNENYNYDLFELTNVDSQLGGAGAFIEYSLEDYLSSSEVPGEVLSIAAAIVTPQSYFPIFDPKLQIRNYDVGETVLNNDRVGVIERWDPIGQLLYVSTNNDFVVGTSLTSLTSNIKSVIDDKIEYNAEIKTGAGATVYDGWQTDSGILNNNLQVIPNNEYYQNFSYSLKSRVAFETWDDSVSALAHASGFEKYSDLVVETSASRRLGAADIDVDAVVDLSEEKSVHCYDDFDIVTERTVDVNGAPISNQIVFENVILQDYFESRGNRVIPIDDISSQFDSNPRSEPFETVSRFGSDYNFAKIFTFVRDSDLLDETQFAIVSVLQDNLNSYTNQYARIESNETLGWFGVGIGSTRTDWDLNFYPYEFEYNNYDVSSFAFNVSGSETDSTNQQLGSVVNITGIHTNISAGVTTTLVSISNTVRAAKLLLQYEDPDSNFYANELNILHDGSEVLELQYGDITNDTGLAGISGFGTYNSFISGSNVVIEFIPSVSVALTCNASLLTVCTSGSSSGVGSTAVRTGDLVSYSTSISASGSPTANTIAQFFDPEASGYFFISIEDTTNNEYELVEIAAIDTQFNSEAITQFGEIYTNVGLGTIGLSTTGSGTNLVFTPNPSIDVEVRAFGLTLKTFDNNTSTKILDLGNTQLISTTGDYTGTEYDKNQDFNLTHNGLPIFSREFDGSDDEVVILASNQIDLPNHYFVTGEKVIYSYEDSTTSTANAIGIATTSIAGVSTTKLPTELFVVKLSENRVSFAASAQDALLPSPLVLDFTDVATSSQHKITTTKQNAKTLLAIDNLIQAPITEAQVSTELDENIVFDTEFTVTGITSFVAPDLIKIDDEFMKIRSIGVGETNRFEVLRAQLGSVAAPHAIGSTVFLMGGNYTIRDSTVFFDGAPFGARPIGTTTDGPDNVDWSGITTNSTFQGRTFVRSGVPETSDDTYEDNYTFDNIQNQFDGVKDTFRLLSDGVAVTGFSTNQAIILNSNILQEPQGDQFSTGDVELNEVAGVTSITYTGNQGSAGYDPGRANVPRGGVLVSVGSSKGLGYQPLVAAGATAVVSTAGTIQSVSIGNSGSGYRPGIQTHIGVFAQSESLGIPTMFSIGTATVQDGLIIGIAVTNGGTGFSQSEPPLVVIDKPLPYHNIPLVYTSDASGSGQEATVDITVGSGTSVIEFELNNFGYAYGSGDALTVEVGGISGIPTDTSVTFNEFRVNVESVYRDTFNGWTIGELDVFDKLDTLFDGRETNFNLTIDGQATSIVAATGSLLNLNYNLLVFINDVLQRPEEAYTFTGGSVIKFSEPPKQGDSSKIIFYKGTPGVDVVFVDVLETVKVGDKLQIQNDATRGQNLGFKQTERVVTGISTLEIADTNPYPGPGVVTDTTFTRPVTWCKQTDDLVINGDFVTKDRVGLEPQIFGASYLTVNVGVTSTFAYVDSVRPIFDQNNETGVVDYQFSITMTDQTDIVGASATVTVSTAGTITSINIGAGGTGYTNLTNPSVTIARPGFTTTGQATGTLTVTGDSVTSATVTSGGVGYTTENPPVVEIEVPTLIREVIGVTTYRGDEAQIVGYGYTNASSTATIDLFIPEDSAFRDPLYVGVAQSTSGIQVGDTFVINNSNVGLSQTSNINGIHTAAVVYDVLKNVDILGFTTSVKRVEFAIAGIGTTSSNKAFEDDEIYGLTSYGRIGFSARPSTSAKTFTASTYGDITSSPLITRNNPLKFVGYSTTP